MTPHIRSIYENVSRPEGGVLVAWNEVRNCLLLTGVTSASE
jgi:hypothetical protein